MARQLLQVEGNLVVAGVRTPSQATALMKLESGAKGRLYLVSIDINEKESVCACADEVARLVGDKGVDYIVNNAAVVSCGSWETAPSESSAWRSI